MALEGDVSNIWKPIAAIHTALVFYSALASLATGCRLWTGPLYYVAGMLGFYAWHFAAHWTTGELYRIHMQHHQDDFASDDFYGDTSDAIRATFPGLDGAPPRLWHLLDPRACTTSTLAHEGPLALAMLAVLVCGYFFLRSSLATLAFVSVGFLLMGAVGSALHVSFHVRDFELEPFAWYRELRSLHYIHHLHRKNFSMVNMVVDMALGSYQTTTTLSTRTHAGLLASEALLDDGGEDFTPQ